MIAWNLKVRRLEVYCVPRKKIKSLEGQTSFEIAEAGRVLWGIPVWPYINENHVNCGTLPDLIITDQIVIGIKDPKLQIGLLEDVDLSTCKVYVSVH